ncbi:hypothetical protein DIPPA_33382 [Diplonema papillatum]|nr:hypothetical protein DIPPA_33382 [Diplonema papillatum]
MATLLAVVWVSTLADRSDWFLGSATVPNITAGFVVNDAAGIATVGISVLDKRPACALEKLHIKNPSSITADDPIDVGTSNHTLTFLAAALDDRVFAVCADDTNATLSDVDLANPNSSRKHLDLPACSGGMVLADEFLYYLCDDSLRIISTEDKGTPQLVDTWKPDNQTSELTSLVGQDSGFLFFVAYDDEQSASVVMMNVTSNGSVTLTSSLKIGPRPTIATLMAHAEEPRVYALVQETQGVNSCQQYLQAYGYDEAGNLTLLANTSVVLWSCRVSAVAVYDDAVFVATLDEGLQTFLFDGHDDKFIVAGAGSLLSAVASMQLSPTTDLGYLVFSPSDFAVVNCSALVVEPSTTMEPATMVPSSAAPAPPKKKSSNHAGTIVGVIVGLLVLAACIGCYVYTRRDAERKSRTAAQLLNAAE